MHNKSSKKYNIKKAYIKNNENFKFAGIPENVGFLHNVHKTKLKLISDIILVSKLKNRF